jgi:hypothetical protein
LNNSKTFGAILIGLGAGLLVGLVVGAIVLSGDDNNPTAAVGNEEPTRTATPTPEPEPTRTPTADPVPTETAGWEPCDKPGLCPFLETLDKRLASQDLDGVMSMIDFVQTQCGSPETELPEGTYPIECREWPYSDAVPTAGFAEIDSQGFPMSRWAIREKLEEFVTGRESDCSGDRERVERRVRVVVSPPDPTLYWNGEVAILLGAPLECQPIIEPDSGQRYVFNLRPDDSGAWKVQSMFEIYYDQCEDSFYRYVGDIRYYPLDAGPPNIPLGRVCLSGDES